MKKTENSINELVRGYTQSKYDEKYMKEKINEILEFILPNIAVIIKNKKKKELANLWNSIKEDERIKNSFRELFEKIDMPIIIYVASKFENNRYFGTKIIEESLKLRS